MKNFNIPLLTLAISVTSCCATPISNYNHPEFGKIKLTLSSEQTLVEYPQPLILTLTVQNIGTEDTVVRLPRRGGDTIFFLEPQEEPYVERRFRSNGLYRRDYPNHFQTLRPSESVSKDFSLKWGFFEEDEIGKKSYRLHKRDIKTSKMKLIVRRETKNEGGVFVEDCLIRFEDHFGAKAFNGEVFSNELIISVKTPQ